MFAAPRPTRLDWNFALFGFPVRVNPFFWATGAFLGFRMLEYGRIGTSLFFAVVVILFVSILVHELGHAVMMRLFRIQSHVVLYWLGGFAISHGGVDWGGTRQRKTIQSILISGAGPFVQFLMAGAMIGFVYAIGGYFRIDPTAWFQPFIPEMPSWCSPFSTVFVWQFLWFNLGWAILNMLPIHPMDGGQIARAITVHFNPATGVDTSLKLSITCAIILTIMSVFIYSSLFMGLLFATMAFLNFQELKGR